VERVIEEVVLGDSVARKGSYWTWETLPEGLKRGELAAYSFRPDVYRWRRFDLQDGHGSDVMECWK